MSAPRFRFLLVSGRVVEGPVQGSGGMVQTRLRLDIARERALEGRNHGLYEPGFGRVRVYPQYTARGDGVAEDVDLRGVLRIDEVP